MSNKAIHDLQLTEFSLIQYAAVICDLCRSNAPLNPCASQKASEHRVTLTDGSAGNDQVNVVSCVENSGLNVCQDPEPSISVVKAGQISYCRASGT